MKTILFAFLMIALCNDVSGQNDKLFVNLEYSPNFTNSTDPLFGSDLLSDGAYRFANNVFLKAGYKLTNNLYANAGVGHLTTKEFFAIQYSYYNIQSEIERLEQLRIHSYVVTPIGFTYLLGSFFINPEIGIGWNVSNRMKDEIYFTDGSIEDNTWVDEHNFYDVNKNTFPLFLSFGNEIRFNSWSVLLGVKGYYSLNRISDRLGNEAHYYGFGLLAGVKF